MTVNANPSVTGEGIKEAVIRAINYVHSCRTEDGGYFFARVTPSSLRDSYFAVKTLQILGQRPRQPATLEHFVRAFLDDHSIVNVHSLYLASEILKALGKPVEPFHKMGEIVISHFQIEGNSRLNTLDVEVISELGSVFEAVSLSLHLDISFDQRAVVNLVLSLRNSDGGFGRERYSTLATTCYAVRILTLLNHPLQQPERVVSFLKKKEGSIYFLENHYYLVMTHSILGEPLTQLEQKVSFISGFQRSNGGFSRAWAMGIPTLEYTYYALSIFKQWGTLN